MTYSANTTLTNHNINLLNHIIVVSVQLFFYLHYTTQYKANLTSILSPTGDVRYLLLVLGKIVN